MSKVLVVGRVPLPYENLKTSYGPGTRTWQFIKPLVEDGHEIVVIGIRIPFVYEDELPTILKTEESGFTLYSLPEREIEQLVFFRDIEESFDPDCVVGATAYPSYIACVSGIDRPIWADVFGSFLAEAQAKAAVLKHDQDLPHFLAVMNTTLARADRFSAVSDRQKYELIGQLGMVGRLLSMNVGYEFAHSIPCGVEEADFDASGAREIRQELGEEAFIILWSGGFNTWTDVDTLFEGVSLAMKEDPRIRFLSTGGSIEGHDEITYPRFVSLVENSPYRERFSLKGWIEKEKARSYYIAANLGINIDAKIYEAALGSRNRILDWALAGLPAVSTDLCELTHELRDAGFLFDFPPKRPGELSNVLLELSKSPKSLKRKGDKLKGFVLEQYSFERTTRPMRDWAEKPGHAPDYEARKVHFVRPHPRDMKPISEDSRLMEKLRFYLKDEGPISTIRRAPAFARRKLRRRVK